MSRYQRRRAARSGESDEPEGGAEEAPRSKRRTEGFDPDYSYVRKDLKRIGALAGFFLAVLVILAFVLN